MVTATLLGLLTEQWGFSMSNSRSSFTLLEQTFGVPAKAPLTVLNRHSNKEDPNGGGVVHRLYPSGFRCQLPAYHAQTCLPTLEQIPLLPSTFNLSPLRYPRANLPMPAPRCHILCTWDVHVTSLQPRHSCLCPVSTEQASSDKCQDS